MHLPSLSLEYASSLFRPGSAGTPVLALRVLMFRLPPGSGEAAGSEGTDIQDTGSLDCGQAWNQHAQPGSENEPHCCQTKGRICFLGLKVDPKIPESLILVRGSGVVPEWRSLQAGKLPSPDISGNNVPKEAI